MPSKCRANCQLHSIFEEEHIRLERLDHLEVLYLRLWAGLPLLEFAQYRFLTNKVRQIRRLERITANQINKISRILSSNGPGCSKCVANGEEFEWKKVKNDSQRIKISPPMVVWSRVCNGTGQYNFSGQRDRSFFIVPGQRDKLKILPRDGTGRDSLSKSGMGRGTGQSLLFCQNPGRDGTITIFFLWFPVLEHLFLF
jgi:hypothetical protein